MTHTTPEVVKFKKEFCGKNVDPTLFMRTVCTATDCYTGLTAKGEEWLTTLTQKHREEIEKAVREERERIEKAIDQTSQELNELDWSRLKYQYHSNISPTKTDKQ